MHRRTPPRGYPRVPTQQDDWGDTTDAGVTDSEELAEIRRRRRLKISQSYAMAEIAQRNADDAKAGLAALRIDHHELGKAVTKMREEQLGLIHTTAQIHTELKALHVASTDAAKESGAWKRQWLQASIAACAVGISLAALLTRAC